MGSPRGSLTRPLPQPLRYGVYEHLTREAGDTNSLRRWETELIFARARLQVIDENIGHIEVLRVAYLSVFPDSAARR